LAGEGLAVSFMSVRRLGAKIHAEVFAKIGYIMYKFMKKSFGRPSFIVARNPHPDF
jgi:hypothetical protein